MNIARISIYVFKAFFHVFRYYKIIYLCIKHYQTDICTKISHYGFLIIGIILPHRHLKENPYMYMHMYLSSNQTGSYEWAWSEASA
mgnify:FL=1